MLQIKGQQRQLNTIIMCEQLNQVKDDKIEFGFPSPVYSIEFMFWVTCRACPFEGNSYHNKSMWAVACLTGHYSVFSFFLSYQQYSLSDSFHFRSPLLRNGIVIHSPVIMKARLWTVVEERTFKFIDNYCFLRLVWDLQLTTAQDVFDSQRMESL